ncbi:MAG: iron complex outermembrane receptor protein [Pseudomonadales bacterium]|jgi:iron complex outermembrane receptor protein
MFARKSICLAVACAAVSTNNVYAKNQLEHIIVTGVLHKTQAETALPVTVVSGEELRNLSTNSIGDTLGSMPGIANASFGPSVGQPVIRGQQGPRVSVLQNGTGSGDASNNSADHAVSVEPVLAESVEVLRGPSTLLYGGGAIGGVVNVIDNRIPTKQIEGLTGAGEIRYGDVNGKTTAVLKIEGGSGPFAFHLDGVKRDSNDINIPGYATNPAVDTPEGEKDVLENTDSDMDTFTFGASFVGDNGFFGLAVSELSNNYGIPAGTHGHHDDEDEDHDEDEHEDEEHHDEDEHEGEDHDEDEGEGNIRIDVEQTRYDLRGGLTNIDGFIDEMRVALTYNDYQHREIEGNGEVGTKFTNESMEGRLELVHGDINGLVGAFGLQFEDSDFAAVGEEAFIPATNTQSYGVFIVEDFHHNDAIYEFGLRYDVDDYDADVGSDESFKSFSASVAGSWTLSQNWHFGAALSSSERAPVVEELYSNNTNALGDYVVHAATNRIEVGDSNLSNEQSNNLDLSLDYHGDTVDAYLTFYYNDFSDYIYLANGNMEQDETDVYFFRQEDAKFYGVEFDVTAALGQVLGGEIELRVFGDAITGELDNSGDVPLLPPLRFGSELNYQNGAFGSYLAVLNAADQDNPGEFENKTDGYTRWDAGMDYRVGKQDSQNALVFLKVKNITDEEIRNSVSVLRDQAPEAGRSIVAGVRISF